MEKTLALITTSTIWYLIFSFVAWNINAFEWHWGVRLLLSLIIIGNIHNAFNRDK
jgi:hypothetical protein